MTKRKVEDDSEDAGSEDEDEAPTKSAKPKAKAAPRKKKDAAIPEPYVTEEGWHIVPPGFMFKWVSAMYTDLRPSKLMTRSCVLNQ